MAGKIDFKMVAKLLPTVHVDAMCKAMRGAGLAVERTATTVIATHSQKGEVFRAMKGSRRAGGNWLIRHAEDLFIKPKEAADVR